MNIQNIIYLSNKILKTTNNNNNSKMDNIQDIITKIKFIGCIKKDEKINVKTMNILPNSLYTSIYRIFQQENRNHTLNFLSSTINRAFEIINSYIHSPNSSDILVCKSLFNDLQSSINGLKNLQYTYVSDRMFYCSISTLIENINNKLLELRMNNSSFFTLEENKNDAPTISV